MKVNAVLPSYSYTNKVLNKPVSPTFEGSLLTTEGLDKIVNKKNIFGLGILTMFLASTMDLFDVRFADLMDFIPYSLLTAVSIIREDTIRLDEKIEFKKAETIEEARRFAEENLKIKNFKIDDLEYANWINEGLTNISNKYKGKVYFPKTIKFYKSKRPQEQGSYSLMQDRMLINKNSIENAANILNIYIESFSFEVLTKYNFGKGYENYCELLERAYKDIDSLTVFEKYSLVSSIQCYNEALGMFKKDKFTEPFYPDVNRYGNIYPDKFDIIYHEIGHCFDFKSDRLIKRLFGKSKNNKIIKNMQLPKYPRSDINEFVASIFSGIMQGEKYQPAVMDMYNKLTNFEKI